MIFPEGRIFGLFNPVFIDEVLKPAFPALVALGAIQGVGDEEQLDDLLSHPEELLRAGRHGNAVESQRGAGGHGLAEALDLYNTESAGTDRQQTLMVAEGGDGDTPLLSRFEDRFSLPGRNSLAVDGQRYHIRYLSFGSGRHRATMPIR
jgi:hypothetical protein